MPDVLIPVSPQTPVVRPWYDPKFSLFQIIPWIALIGLGYFVYDLKTNPAPAYNVAIDPEGVKLGTAFLPLRNDAYAQSVDACIQDIITGKSIEEAQQHMSEVEQKIRSKAFVEIIGPSILKIIPAGTKELTSDQKDAFASFMRGVAKPFKAKR